MPLTATSDPGHHHFAADVVYFYMKNGDQRVRCGVSRLSLELLEPDLPPTKQGRIQAFKQRRARIERTASAKFDRGHFEPDGSTVLVRAVDLVEGDDDRAHPLLSHGGISIGSLAGSRIDSHSSGVGLIVPAGRSYAAMLRPYLRQKLTRP